MKHRVGYLCALFVVATGCATVDQRAGFSDVKAAVETRSGKQVAWNLGTELDAQVAEEVRALLADTLNADEAVQVALLNNRELQAMYAELGVAQADLVQAGLLSNPVFDGTIFFPISSGPSKLELSVAMGFLDIAMHFGVIDLLRAREEQIQAAIAYVDTLLDYWLARTDLEQLLSGRLPKPEGGTADRRAGSRNTSENAAH